MQVIILMGLPGAGKTYWSKTNHPTAVVCSADHYFTDAEGNYNFDAKKLGQAHAWCMRNFIRALTNAEQQFAYAYETDDTLTMETWQPQYTVIVDNRNVNVHSIAPYIGVASSFGVFPRIVYVRDPGNAQERQLHKVPEFNWQAMRYQLNELLSKWPGIWPKLEPVLS